MRNKFVHLLLTLVMGLGLSAVAAVVAESPALANGPCSTNQLCLFDSYLSESGNAWFRSAVSAGCYPTNANGLDHLTYSVKNLTSKKMTVYHTTNCTDGGYGISYLYANTSGNLAYPWNGGNPSGHTGIISFRVP